jgi:hypothetical protein
VGGGGSRTGLVVELVGLLVLARRVLLNGLLDHIDGTAQEVGVAHVEGATREVCSDTGNVQ